MVREKQSKVPDPQPVLAKEFGAKTFPLDESKARAMLAAGCGARIKTWLSICSRCGLCAESCFVYLSNDRDPRLSPAYKFRHTLGEMVRRKGSFDRAFLEKCFTIAWLQCTMCKRCSIYCPFGIDIAAMIMLARNLCFSQGVGSGRMLEFTQNCRQSGNHMGLPPAEVVDTCAWVAEEVQEEYRGVDIPIDTPDVKYMYTINPREVVFFPQDITDAAVLLTAAQESWTMPTFGWDCTNLPMLAGDREAGGQQVQNVYDKARELGAEYILITECGHAYRSLVFEGPYMAGIAGGRPPVKIKHFVELVYEYLRDGRIRIDPQKKIKEPVTYQDPCNVSRNGGLWEEPRRAISYLAEDFRDMAPNRDYNHCCGGGSGILPMGPDYKPFRLANGRTKAEQIRATGAKIVIAPCHNCYDQIQDLNEEYHLGVKVMSFKEIIRKAMIVPEHMRVDQKVLEDK